MKNDIKFYRQLWSRLVGEEFTPQKLVARLQVDGGVDIKNLSETDLLDMIEGRFKSPWTEAAFTFSELLASYSVLEGIQTGDQVVSWVFSSFMIADAIQHQAIDWELEFNKFMDGFLIVRDRLETEEAVHIFQRVFCD